MLCFPVEGQGTAVEQHQYGGLAQLADGLYQFGLRGGQLDVFAVAFLEAGHLHVHLFTFQQRAEAHAQDDGIRLLGRPDGFCFQVGFGRVPQHAHDGVFGVVLEVFHADFIGLSSFEVYPLVFFARMVQALPLGEQRVVQVELEARVSFSA